MASLDCSAGEECLGRVSRAVLPITSAMIDESFSQRCSVVDSTTDYGYGDTAAPETAKLGCASTASNDLGYGTTESNNEYGDGNDNDQQQEQQRRRERPRRRGSITKYSLDAQQEVQQEDQTQQLHAASTEVKDIHFDPTSMGYDDAVVALNDAPPTPSGRIRKSRKSSQQSDSSDTSGTSVTSADKYGYGDTSVTSADKYGYGDTSNTTSADKYGYGDTSNTTSADKYGYGDTSNTSAEDKYGYGDTSNTSGEDKYAYGDTTSTHSGQSADSQRHRPRRRGSVTKYSLEATATVADEDQEQLAPPLQQEYLVCSRPLSTEDSMEDYHDESKSCDDDATSHDGGSEDGKKKKRKGGRFSRLRTIGKSLSHSSKDSK